MASVTWSGLDEFKTAMQQLPDHLVGEATGIVQGAADRAQDAMFSGYPEVHGYLRKGLKQEQKNIGRYGIAVVVKSTAKHAAIYENGTQARHTKLGANRGVMPPGNVVIPAAVRHRAGMYQELREMLIREGFAVSGSAP